MKYFLPGGETGTAATVLASLGVKAKVAGIDPFFLEETCEAARLCVKNHIPYVTIDCPHTDYLHQHAEINVISKECRISSAAFSALSARRDVPLF